MAFVLLGFRLVVRGRCDQRVDRRGAALDTRRPADRQRTALTLDASWRARWAFLLGLLLVRAASAGLEWSRLYPWDDALPGSAGGILGYLGRSIARSSGSALPLPLLGIAVLVLGVALVFQFSWSQVAERIGGALMALVESRRGSK